MSTQGLTAARTRSIPVRCSARTSTWAPATRSVPASSSWGPCSIGDDNWIGAHAVIGAPAEIKGIDHGAAWNGELVGTGVTIGSGNVFRELVTVHQGHYDTTVIGSGCYFMNKVYIGHDGGWATASPWRHRSPSAVTSMSGTVPTSA